MNHIVIESSLESDKMVGDVGLANRVGNPAGAPKHHIGKSTGETNCVGKLNTGKSGGAISHFGREMLMVRMRVHKAK